jgi:hypothetical protein
MQKQIDMGKFSTVLGGISVRGRGYFEAVVKIAEGQRLVDEGKFELAQLDGKKSGDKRQSASGDGGIDVTAAVRKLGEKPYSAKIFKEFLEDGPLSSSDLAARAGCKAETARRIMTETDGVHRIGTGAGVRWELDSKPSKTRIVRKATIANKTSRKSPSKNKTSPGDFGIEAPRCKMVLEAVQKNPWLNTSRIAKEVLGNHATAVEICDLLEKAGMIWKVEKANNPAHKGHGYDRTLTYWEADPKAKIEVVNMHVPRAIVRDVEAYFPAIEAAIRAGDGWTNKLHLKAHTGISEGPLDRILDAMKKQKRVKTVTKKHNPKHVLPKNYEKAHEYWELVDAE